MKSRVTQTLLLVIIIGCKPLPSLYIANDHPLYRHHTESLFSIYDYGDSIAYFREEPNKDILGFCCRRSSEKDSITFVSVFRENGYYNLRKSKSGKSPTSLTFLDTEKFNPENLEKLDLYVQFEDSTYQIEQNEKCEFDWPTASNGSELIYYSKMPDGRKTIRYKAFVTRETTYLSVKNHRELTERIFTLDSCNVSISRISEDEIILSSPFLNDTLYKLQNSQNQKNMRLGAFYK